MPLLPYQKFSVSTPVAPSTAAERLAAAVAPSPWFGRAVTALPFGGWVRGTEFKLHRVITERMNSFVPIVRGRIVEVPGGSRLEGTMRLHAAVALLMLWWCGSFAVFAAQLVLREGWPSGARRWDLLFLIAAPVGGWALCAGTFTYEARRACRLLAQALAGTDQRAAT